MAFASHSQFLEADQAPSLARTVSKEQKPFNFYYFSYLQYNYIIFFINNQLRFK
jgi:hypothetical protein